MGALGALAVQQNMMGDGASSDLEQTSDPWKVVVRAQPQEGIETQRVEGTGNYMGQSHPSRNTKTNQLCIRDHAEVIHIYIHSLHLSD